MILLRSTLFLLGLVVCTAKALGDLPENWESLDLGVPSREGTAEFSGDAWTISGGGSGVCPASQFRFTFTEEDETGGITARVESVQGAHFYSQAGLMMREDITAGSPQAMLLTTATNGVMFQWRPTPGSGCLSYSLGGLGAPIWLKLARSKTNITAYYSLNGMDWSRMGEPQPVSLSKKALVGMAVTANDDAQLCTAVFTHMALAEPTFGIASQIWTNLASSAGNSLEALTNINLNPDWPASASGNFIQQAFEVVWVENRSVAGERFRAFVIPPTSGNYHFAISSANASELWLSSDEQPANSTRVAWVSSGTAEGDWLHETNQQSAPMALEAGRRYYAEARFLRLALEGHLSVRWELPSHALETPLSSETSAGGRLMPFRDVDHLPGIFEQPQGLLITDGGTARFSLLATNQSPVGYQWRVAGTNRTGATASVFEIGQVNAAFYSGVEVSCIVSNAVGAVTSAPVVLTVLADREAPGVLRAVYAGSNSVTISFSEPITEESATNTGNFVFTNTVTVLRAGLSPDGTVITLDTSGMEEGAMHQIVINGIYDRATTANLLPTNTTVSFFSAPYSPESVGGATPPGTIALRLDGYDVSGGGADVGLYTDQFQFAWAYREGDFDMGVRLGSLSQTDAFAKAGLMLRESLAANSRYAAVFCTPTIGGTFFSSRTFPGTRALSSGNVPVNLPYTWLRLRRVGSKLLGYASYDGVVWQLLGTSTLPIESGAYFGMAVCSRNPAQLAVAEFRDLEPVNHPAEGLIKVSGEPLGPCSRTTGLVISEIMYHPADNPDGRNLEYVELFNSQPWPEDISGFRLGGDIAFTFPADTTLAAGAFLVVAANPADVTAVYGIGNVTGPYTNRLSNSSGTVELRDRFNALLLKALFDSQPPWPVAPDGAGPSLVLRNPSYGERSRMAWAASETVGGSPGGTDGLAPQAASAVCINEILARSEPPLMDYIEIFNPGPATADLSDCYLTDDPDQFKFKLPANTLLDAGEFICFHEDTLGFRLAAEGEKVFLFNAIRSRVLDAVSYGGQMASRPSGRFPDGSPEFAILSDLTPGAPNAVPYEHSVVINELLYNPISGDDDDEFIELCNRGTNTIDLSRWKLRGGISFTFPDGAVVAPDSYVVVGRNRRRLFENYPQINPAIVFGDYQGVLSNKGERIELSHPEAIITTNNAGKAVTNEFYLVADEVEYGTGGQWGRWSDGGGSSLELVNPRVDNRLAPNWRDSDEPTKAPWTTIETTGVLDNGSTGYPATQLHAGLSGIGECLLDEIEVFRPGETNLLPNGKFNSSAAGWVFQGTHRLSGFQPADGYTGGGCLKVRATGRVDTGANRMRAGLTGGLNSGATATLRAKARWLRGNPELLLRLRGNWLEAAGRMLTPRNIGTPGQRNSRHVAAPAPAITEVVHWPVVPAVSDPITVTARVASPDGVSSVRLVYRNDTASTTAQAVIMNDAGTGPDQRAGDGIFSGMVPSPNSKSVLAFYVEAISASPDRSAGRFPAAAPAQECLVGFGEPPITGLLGSYRLWVTKTNISWWTSREKNSNEPLDATFVYNNTRVVHNMRTLYSGSPFHARNYSSPIAGACDYVMTMPDDDLVLGARDFVLATAGNLGNDDTLQREQTAFWMLRELGARSLHRRHVLVFLNGVKRGSVYEDSQQPNGDVVEEYWPDDSNGQLFKIEDWFEFDDAGSSFSYITATLGNFTTVGGQKKAARYRWNWRPRAVKESSHNFTNLFTLVDSLRATRPEPYTQAVQSRVDVEEWMRVLAVERIAGNWDSYSYDRGKNMYAYKPGNGPWELIPWDIDFVWDLGDSATTELFSGHDSVINTLRTHPPFARAYWRAFHDAANGPMLASKVGAILDAKYAGLQASGISCSPPTPIKTYIAARRNYLLSQLGTVNAAFNAAAPAVNGSAAILSGTAPVGVKTLNFNGIPYPVTWSSVTAWTAAVPLRPGVNSILVTGLDSSGQLLPGAARSVTANYPGPVSQFSPGVVINEIQFKSDYPGAEFIELHNPSSAFAFDLSGWELNGLSYTFPQGAFLAPGGYLVLAHDREAMAAAYGVETPVFDTFRGTLKLDGETLTLLAGGSDGTSVGKVRYESAAPWPTNTTGVGPSLQLIDPDKDQWRAGNWESTQTNSVPCAQWVFVSATGTGSSSSLYMYLQSRGEIFLDDVQLVEGTVPGVGQNLISNGDFEVALGNEWVLGRIFSQSTRSTDIKRSGEASLRMVSTGKGSTRASSISQEIRPSLTASVTYTLSFWYLQSTNGGPLVLRLSGNGITTGSVTPAPAGGGIAAPSTPGVANSIARTLPTFPALYINEIQSENRSGITNGAGVRSAWVELFNSSTNTVSLQELYLSTNYHDLAAWSFPTGATIPPLGFRIIFLDGNGDLSAPDEPHAPFSLPLRSGTLALSRPGDRGKPQVLDYLTYENLSSDRSFGSIPDGQSFVRREMAIVTPGQTNNGAAPMLTVAINEWMAENSSSLRDPADNDFEDWFELYNFGTDPVDLGGYYLSDNLDDKLRFLVPSGHYVIPPKGFLLVWADNETGQNNSARKELHVNFKLAKEGETIGLFGPEGQAVDLVTFGAQAADISQGRSPDGASTIITFERASPGTNNVVPNTPPTIIPLPDLTVYLGQAVECQCTATDIDKPPQNLVFSIADPAPPGAGINPATGFFRWFPSSVLSTNITIVVRDSGVPALSAEQAFRIVVIPLPQLHGFRQNQGLWSMSLATITGKSYQLETTDDLLAGVWVEVGSEMLGTGGAIEFTVDSPTVARQFYRVRIQ